MFDYALEYIFSIEIHIDSPPDSLGLLPAGYRTNYYISGGMASGPKFNGTLRSGGGDWLTLRPDRVCTLDVRATLEADDGALVDVAYTGVVDVSEKDYQDLLADKLPNNLQPRIAVRFATASPAYAWLNCLQALGVGQADLSAARVRYDLYALR